MRKMQFVKTNNVQTRPAMQACLRQMRRRNAARMEENRHWVCYRRVCFIRDRSYAKRGHGDKRQACILI